MNQITPRHDLGAEEVGALEGRLDAFNIARTGFDDAQNLAFLAEEDGALVGGVAGYSWGGICELQQVWVAEGRRGQGLGRDLMAAAIAEATRRGCARVFLATYDFQAPDFYARLGFRVVATIEDKPIGRTEFIMRRDLG